MTSTSSSANEQASWHSPLIKNKIEVLFQFLFILKLLISY